MTPFFTRRKLRLREIEELVQHHPAGEWPCPQSTPPSLHSGYTGICTPQDSFHLSRNLCPSHLPPPPNESSQGQGTFQPSSVCPACLGDDKKQFIISLHCKVIRNRWRFPSSLGFPLSDNSVGGFPLGPCLPHSLSDFPSLSVSFPTSPGGWCNEMSEG